ncbi:hypothetical protein F0726_01522 [Acidithiobacillus caldus]|nr:hypothetical protein F0726_01522 [Acidithiobacillus caldus]
MAWQGRRQVAFAGDLTRLVTKAEGICTPESTRSGGGVRSGTAVVEDGCPGTAEALPFRP